MKKIFSLLGILTALAVSIPAAHALQEETITSVVYIDVYNQFGDNYFGTGTIFSGDALILTAAHVILDDTTGLPSDHIDICTLKNEYQVPDCKYSARVLTYDTDNDLAIIYPAFKIDENRNEIEESEITDEEALNLNLPYVDLGDYIPNLGDEITILGYPQASLTSTITLTEGKVSGFIPLSDDVIWYYTTDATINPGNSGGPAYNSEEKIIGVVSLVSTEGVGGNYGYVVSNDMLALWFYDLVDQEILNKEFVDEVFNNDYSNSKETFSNTTIFTDVSINTKNSEAIAYLKANNIVSGYEDGTFKPQNKLNRAELLKILVEGAGYSPSASDYKNCFTDIKDEWFAPYVCFAKEKNWIVGYEDNTFRPANNINKVEAIKMLLEVFSIKTSVPQGSPYSDVQIGEWYTAYINTAKNLGLLEETGDNYNPGNEISRGQISENIYRLLILQEKNQAQAFAGATYESMCYLLKEATPEEYQQEDIPERLKTAIKKIYTQYGFDADNEAALDAIMEKYQDTPELLDAMEKAQADCLPQS